MLDDFINLLDSILDSKRKRHITGGILLSAALLFGGLARAKEFLLGPIEESMNEHLLNLWKGKIKIVFSQLKESDAAILGASALAWELDK